jgi:hypothetical protein
MLKRVVGVNEVSIDGEGKFAWGNFSGQSAFLSALNKITLMRKL